MTTQTHWIDILACRTLIETSVRHVDAGDAPAFAALFTEDAVLVRPNGSLLEGRAAIHAAYAQRAADRVTRHLVTNVAVTLEDGGRAQARSYVLLWTGSMKKVIGTSRAVAIVAERPGIQPTTRP